MQQPAAKAPARRNRPLPAILLQSSRMLACGLLICLALALYLPSVHYSFLNYDDDEYVTANSHVRSGLTVASLKWAFSNIDIGHWQPITWITHLADCSFYGLNPAGHHLTSVLLHTVNVCFLFVFLYWITGAWGRSLMVAAAFAVHPVNVEVVAWIAERKTLVCTFFTFAAGVAYVWYAARPRLGRYVVVVLAFSLAVMSKSMAVTVPLLLLLLDYWALGRWENHPIPAALNVPPQSTARLLLEKAPLLAISSAISLLTLYAQEKGNAVNHDPLGGRIAHALWSYAAYVGKVAWPSKLSILYPYPVHGHPVWVVALAVVGLGLASGAVLRAKSEPYLAIGWFFYLVSMLPVIGIVRVGPQSLSDHYLYIPAIGLFVLATWGVHDILNWALIRPEAAALVGAAVILVYAIATAAYLPSWSNSLVLFTRAERLSPAADDMIETNLAEALREVGRPSESIPHYRSAIALAPQMHLPRCNLGSALVATGDPYDAIAEIQAALQRSPSGKLKAQCLNNLAVAQLVLNRPDLAEQSFSGALEIDPNSEHSLVGRGLARFRLRELDGALDDLRRAVAVDPDPVAYFWLGKTLAAENQREPAIAALKRSLALAPERKEVQAELDNLTRGEGSKTGDRVSN